MRTLRFAIAAGVLAAVRPACPSPPEGTVAEERPGTAILSTADAHRIIVQCYAEYLERAPDPGGFETYTRALLREGRDEPWLRHVLSRSPERQRLLERRHRESRQRVRRVVTGILVSSALLLSVCFARCRRFRPARARLQGWVVRELAPRMNAWGGMLFRRRRGLAMALLCLGVYFEFHGHSIGLWDRHVLEKTPGYSFFSIGASHPIRSDEWLVSTPWCIAQTQTVPRFPAHNTRLYTSGMYMGLTTPGCPVWNVTAIGQFHNWGFFLFGPSRGLAWSWWVRYMGILLLAMEFLLIAGARDKRLVFAGALSVTLASPTQWWDTTVPYHLLYFFGFAVAFWHFLKADSVPKTACAAAACAVSFCSFLLAFYPPFQVPLLIALLAVCGCFCVTGPRRPFATFRLLCAAAAVTVAAWVLWRFAADNREGIARIAGSVYPGRRFFTGGHRTYGKHFLWPLMSLYFPFREATLHNNCEMSMFLVPFPALLVMVPWLLWRARSGMEKRVFLALSAVGAFLVAWCLFQFPAFVARYSLLFVAHPHRVFVAASFVLLVACIVGGALIARQGLSLRRGACVAAGVAGVLCFLIFVAMTPFAREFYLGRPWPVLGPLAMAGSAALFGALNYGLLRGNVRAVASALILYALIAGLTVHPLVRGIDPIMQKTLRAVVLRLQSEAPEAKWVDVSRSQMLSQYLTALGLSTVTGVHGIPDVPFWRRLDPEGRFEESYNRYAHVQISLGEEGPFFESPHGDVLRCVLRPEDLRRMPDVRFVLARHELPDADFELLEHVRAEDLYIYRLRTEPLREAPAEGASGSTEDAAPAPFKPGSSSGPGQSRP